MAICIYSTVTINQLITNTVAANSKFKTEIAKAQFLKKYEFWGPCNIKSMVRIMVKSLCVVGLVLENWYLICGQISCLHIATHFHTLTFYWNRVIFEAGWHPPVYGITNLNNVILGSDLCEKYLVYAHDILRPALSRVMGRIKFILGRPELTQTYIHVLN